MMNELNTDSTMTDYLLADVGAPFIIGLAVGYFAKKAIKIGLFLGGMAIVLLFVTEYYGMTEVSDTGLQHVTDIATGAVKQSGGFLVDRLSHITGKGLSSVAGFFVGLKVG